MTATAGADRYLEGSLVFHPDMRKRAFTSLTSCVLIASLAIAVAIPAAADATIHEVGLITKTEPETVPSCTSGPIGLVGKKMEEAKKKAEEAEKLKAKEEAKKKREAERRKKRSPKKTTARRARAAEASAAATATSTEEATTEEATSTEAPCLAISRTTGFQTKVGSVNSPLTIPANGRIVAWTIDLGRPTSTQTKFFDENEGGVAEAGISILQPEKAPAMTYKLIAASPVVKLQSYFGLNTQLALEKSIKVKAGDIVALTVPTWAPALALGFEKSTAWRASREAKACSVTNTETAQVELKSKVTYSCRYLTARLAYSATEISSP